MLRCLIVLCLLSAGLRAESGFVAREWGVIEAGHGDPAQLLALPAPSPTAIPSSPNTQIEKDFHFPHHSGFGAVVREPVLYIESADQAPFSLRVRFPNGHPSSSFPRGLSIGNTLLWDRVLFKGPATEALADCDKPIVELLGEAGADQLFVHGQGSRYLFYEGEAQFKPAIELVFKGQQLTVHNRSGQALNDILLVRAKNGACEHARIASLVGGGSLPVTYKAGSGEAEFPDLGAQGFKPAEALAFAKVWKPIVCGCSAELAPGDTGHDTMSPGHAFYQLPAGVVESISRLEFDPAPSKLTRAMFAHESLSFSLQLP